MACNIRTIFVASLASIVFLTSLYHHHHLFHPQPIISSENLPLHPHIHPNYAIQEHHHHQQQIVPDSIPSVSILLPAWEVLVVVSPATPIPPDFIAGPFTCLFPNNVSSPAKPAGFLPAPYRTTFKCDFPTILHRRLPFPQPILTRSPERSTLPQSPELLRWNFLVYDSLSTENDVALFVKGLNHRQGGYRLANEFRCVFGDDDGVNGVKTTVTTSYQEVFRCRIPETSAFSNSGGGRIRISLEMSEQKRVVPSLAYYTPARKVVVEQPKSLLCACTMVYNVAKFLKEWVVYHSSIGVDRFILYDNESDDDLQRVVQELVQEGYNVTILFWLWPKTQEAGFSHSAIYANTSCSWMMYIDVDEFVYSPSWLNSPNPSHQMLKSLLPQSPSSKIGQVMISCYEFGPSNQSSHPLMGVTQGYNCRRRSDNRHKSIVLLDAVDESLLNVIHHFKLKQGYREMKMSVEDAVVNHYKFQAWSEFKTKFRRRVSAYVVDWMQEMNPESKDRTPGLGFVPVEPEGWLEKFCEEYDERLKDLTRRWFGFESPPADVGKDE
ncbi:glycosyltransferase family 92 protein RCOM_0530710-like [Camellia sinensis]|uniref:glycosyltransferase family 92 protein RCOM_0530710-like n=1 Tax=Camellia sinensis TaxID=4442 RepID=UPI001036A2BE|nr:glycosyltransferase family 92 protein RCOM_0530710-like [Camellia sinensis]